MNSSSLGSTLRAHREGQGLSLDAVAKATKISGALLADLERNDLSRWPLGIYRRAFVREYAKAIRFPPERVLDECCGLSPEPASVVSRSHTGIAHGDVVGRETSELRLTLAMPSISAARVIGPRLAAAIASLASVLAIGYVLTIAADVAYWTASGITALVWYPGSEIYSAARRLRRGRRHRVPQSSEVTTREHMEVLLSVDAGGSAADPMVAVRDSAVRAPFEEHPTLH